MSADLRQIVGHLQPEPHICCATNRLFEPNGHFRRNSALPIDDSIKLLARYAHSFGRFGHAQAQGFQIVSQPCAGVGWILHRHRFTYSVVVNEIDIEGPAILEAKNDPPIARTVIAQKPLRSPLSW